MHKPKYHFFLCNSFRINGDAQGYCNRRSSPALLQYLQGEINDRGMDAIVSSTSCLNVCERGPVLVIYPQEIWCFGLNEKKIDEILNALENHRPVPELVLA